ncbi:MAG: cellulase family glycosylhydrolase [Myxococcales bacterium]
MRGIPAPHLPLALVTLGALTVPAACSSDRAPLPHQAAPPPMVPLVAGDLESGSGCPPLPPIVGFVGRGDATLLTEGLSPVRGTGSNLYYLQQLLTYAQQDTDAKVAAAVGEVLDDLVCLSLPLARIWGFNDSPDRSSIRKGPHDFQESGLRGLDQAVWEAKRRGIRLIIPLVNNWADYGGLPAYAAWASKEDGIVHIHDDFFSDGRLRQWWKDYVAMLAERVNTFTGIAYRDEPAILAWEIGNEFRCATCRGTTRLVDTVRELAQFLRGMMPNHLVADGGEGFDDQPGLYLGLSNSYPIRGDEGSSFSKLAAVDELDMISYHLYPKNYGLESPRDTEIWIQRHQAIATVFGKVAYLGECGYMASDADRASSYDSWLRHLFDENGGPIGLMWQLLPNARLANDRFSVYSRRDRATAWILSRWGAALR